MPRVFRKGRRSRPAQPPEVTPPAEAASEEEWGNLDRAGLEPFVPVPDEDAYALRAYSYRAEPPLPAADVGRGTARRRRLRPLHLLASLQIRWGWLILALALIVGGVIGTLLRQNRLSEADIAWWPILILALAGLWMLLALIRRRVTLFLGGAALAGAGLSALLDTQGVAVLRETLLGLVLVSIGLGIVIRGFVLRGRIAR